MRQVHELEAELVTAYIATLGYRPRTEYRIGRDTGTGLRADIYNETRRLIIEAKASVDGLFPAIGQVHRYRYLENLAHKKNVVDRVAVLLPSRPSVTGTDLVWEREVSRRRGWSASHTAGSAKGRC